MSLSDFISPVSLRESLPPTFPSGHVHFFHRLLSRLISKSLDVFSHLQILSPLMASLAISSLPTPVPAHSFPKPPNGHLEGLGRNYLTQDEHPQNGGTPESQPHWEKPRVPRQMPSILFCFLPPVLVGNITISYPPENRVFKDKGEICLHAQHMPDSSKPRCSHQGDWQNSPKGGPLGTQAKVAPFGWAPDPSLSPSTQLML